MDIWDIARLLSTLDLKGAGGFNAFSLLCFSLMALYSLRISLKHNPHNFSRIPKILVMAIFPLLTFYCLLDATVGLVYVFTRADIVPAMIHEAYIRMMPSLGITNAPWLLIAFLIIFDRYYLHSFNYKRFLPTWFATVGILLASAFVFGEVNMRLLSGDTRTWFYILSFVPTWLFWTVAYLKIWRK